MVSDAHFTGRLRQQVPFELPPREHPDWETLVGRGRIWLSIWRSVQDEGRTGELLRAQLACELDRLAGDVPHPGALVTVGVWGSVPSPEDTWRTVRRELHSRPALIAAFFRLNRPDLYDQVLESVLPADPVPDAVSECEAADRSAPRIGLAEATLRVRELLQQNPRMTVRVVALEIGCSTGLVSKTLPWRAMRAQRREDKNPGEPRAVAFTDKLEAVTGTGSRDEALKELIREQEDDAEPSPLEPDGVGDRPRPVRARRRV